MSRRRPDFAKLIQVPWRAVGNRNHWRVVADIRSSGGGDITVIVYAAGKEDGQQLCTYIAAAHNKGLMTSEERWQ